MQNKKQKKKSVRYLQKLNEIYMQNKTNKKGWEIVVEVHQNILRTTQTAAEDIIELYEINNTTSRTTPPQKAREITEVLQDCTQAEQNKKVRCFYY